MKKLAAVVLLAVSLVLVGFRPVHSIDTRAVSDYVAERSVILTSADPDVMSSCSGTIIDKDHVLTARHCTEFPKPQATKTDGTTVEAVMAYWPDDNRDIAILKVPGIGCPCAASIAYDKDVRQWEDAVTAGYPYGLGPTVTFGAVQGVVEYEGPYQQVGELIKFLYISINVDPGNSGGGVYVIRENELYLIGVVSMAPPSGNTALVVTIS